MERVLGRYRFVSRDGMFDLSKIPMEVLDSGWQRYHPYLYSINYRNPLARGYIEESTDYKKQIEEVRDAILSTFPISEEQFKIDEGSHGLYAAILVALTHDNVEIIERAMEGHGFFRSRPTDGQLGEILSDAKGRPWIDIRFEPMDPDDVTDEVHRKYSVLYHLTPSIFEDRIKRDGLKVSNNNPEYRYSESRAFLCEGDASEDDIRELANALYKQAKDRGIKNLSPEYSKFVFDLSRMGKDFRFFYDINEPKGLYTKVPIPPKYISSIERIVVHDTDRLP